MNHFSYKIYLLLFCMAASSLAGGWLFAKGLWAQGCLCLICGGIAVIILLILIGNLKNILPTFLTALEAGDSTLSIKIKGDRQLERTSEAMDRIAGIYGSAIHDIKTRKLFYDRILRVMTHEIRNDLSPIISLSGEMAGNPEKFTPEEMADALGLILSQSLDLKRFLDSYYELTHIPEPAMRKVNVNSFMMDLRAKHTMSDIALKLPKDTLKFITPVELEAEFDPALVARALGNLIRNALEAVAGKEMPKVEVTASVSDDELFFTIKDNGTGFSRDADANLFLPFYSTKSGGSGIGLYLSRQIARLHKGELSITSQPGKGTTVTMTLGHH